MKEPAAEWGIVLPEDWDEQAKIFEEQKPEEKPETKTPDLAAQQEEYLEEGDEEEDE